MIEALGQTLLLPPAWERLEAELNDRQGPFGVAGVRDPDYPCESFDGAGYNGKGRCHSDGHYLCTECSQLAPDAPRFQHGSGAWLGRRMASRLERRAGRAYRLRLFWARPR